MLHGWVDDGGPERPDAGAYACEEAGRGADDADRARAPAPPAWPMPPPAPAMPKTTRYFGRRERHPDGLGALRRQGDDQWAGDQEHRQPAQFVSFGLKPGFSYKYVVKAQVVRNGQVQEDTRTVTLTAGEVTAVAFGFNTPAEQVASAQ